jgi:hypothetical protein
MRDLAWAWARFFLDLGFITLVTLMFPYANANPGLWVWLARAAFGLMLVHDVWQIRAAIRRRPSSD